MQSDVPSFALLTLPSGICYLMCAGIYTRGLFSCLIRVHKSSSSKNDLAGLALEHKLTVGIAIAPVGVTTYKTIPDTRAYVADLLIPWSRPIRQGIGHDAPDDDGISWISGGVVRIITSQALSMGIVLSLLGFVNILCIINAVMCFSIRTIG